MNKLQETLHEIASAIKYKLNTDEAITPATFATKIAQIPVESGGSQDPTPLIDGTIRLVKNNANSIRPYTFYDCKDLTAATFPNCTNIASGVFQDCSNLKAAYFNACTEIKSDAFKNCINLRIASFPSCVKIGPAAFMNCGISTISFPLCETVGFSAFMNCSNLTTVDLPQVKSISTTAFSGCTNLINLNLPECTYIESKAFLSTGLSGELNLPNVISIGGGAFVDTNITKAILPNCITLGMTGGQVFTQNSNIEIYAPKCSALGSSLFQNFKLSSLSNIVLNYSELTTLNQGTFFGNNFSELAFPALETLGYNTFGACSLLTTLSASNLNIIGQSAFVNCYNLTQLIGAKYMPRASTENIIIGSTLSTWAFWNCTKLSNITILAPAAENWGISIFEGCQQLSKVVLFCPPYNYSSRSVSTIFKSTPIMSSSYLGYFGSIYVPPYYLNSYKSTWLAIASRITALETDDYILPYEFANSDITAVPENKINAKSIYVSAFNSSSNLETISLPSCIVVGANAFIGCSNLSTVNLPACRYIDKWAFLQNSALTAVSLPTCIKIKERAFYGCINLSSINLPVCETLEGSSIFGSCTNLTSISLPKCEKIPSYAFSGCSNLGGILSLPACKEIESSAFTNTAISKIYLPECYSISHYAFTSCQNLSSIGPEDLPKISQLGAGVFGNCHNLKTAALDFKYISTGYYGGLFENCDNLESVTLLNNPIIGATWFAGCSKLTNISFSAAMTGIRSSAFANCIALSTIQLTSNLEEIRASAFAGCSQLAAINIPNKIVEIESGTFKNCTSLSSVDIQGNLEIIGEEAFYNCTNLSSIQLPITVNSIYRNAFYGCPIPRIQGSQFKYINFYGGLNSNIKYLEAVIDTSKTSYKITNNNCTKVILDTLAFSSCTQVQKIAFSCDINIPQGNYTLAFAGSRANLNAIYFTNNAVVNNYAFAYCRNLSSVYLFGNNVSNCLNRFAFYDTPMVAQSNPGTFYVRASLVSAYIEYLSNFNGWTTSPGYGGGSTSYYGLSYASVVGLTDEEINNILAEINNWE